MDLAQAQYRIRQLLAVFRYEVEQASKVGALDINKYAETMLIPLFREVYGYTELKNLNAEVANYPGIDLGDETAGVAFQITASSDSRKVKHTLEEFTKHKHYERYNRLIIYVLTQKQKSYSGRGYDEIIQQQFTFDKDRDIMDFLDVIRVIDTFPLETARRVLAVLVENFGDDVANLPPATIGSQRDIGATPLALGESSTDPNTQSITQENIVAFVQALAHFSAQASTNQTPNTDPEDAGIQAQVELARNFVQDSKYDAAFTILLKLRAPEQLEHLSTGLRFDIANLIGCCVLEAGDIGAAQGYFAEALQLDPNSVKALVNSSTTAVFAHDAQKAIELSSRARKLDPDNPIVLLAHLQALFAAGRIDEVRQFLVDEPELAQNPSSAPILARIAFEAGNYDTAEELAGKAADAEPNNIDHILMLADVLIAMSSSDSSKDGDGVNWRREKLSTAEELLSRAVLLAEQQNKNLQLRVALSNRSAVRNMLGQLGDALRDAERVLDHDADDPNALENKGRILMRMGQPQAAVLCFEALLHNARQSEVRYLRYVTIGGANQQGEVRGLLADAYLRAGQPEKVNEILPATSDFKVADEAQLGELELRLVASEVLGDELTVAKIIENLEQDWPRSAIAKLILAGHRARQKDLDAAGRLLEQALAVAQGRLRDEITLQLAQIRFQEGNYVEAARLFAPHVDTSYDNPDLRGYVASLYNSRQFSEALRLTAQVRADIGPIAGISEIELKILEEGGDLDGAREVLQQLIDAQVDVLTSQAHLAYIEYRSLNLDAARQLVLSISYDAVRNNARLLVNLARLRLLLGLPNVLDFAYQARRLDYADPEVHVRYLITCLELHGPESALSLQEPEAVSVNTSVHVRRDDVITVFTILDDRQVFADRGELCVEDPLAQGLLGRRKGEHVITNGGFMREHEYEIVDIQTKYLWASHESTLMFHSGKLRDPALNVLHGTPENLAEHLIKFMDQHAQHAPDIHEFYYKRHLPLSVVAALVKRHVIDIWLVFSESPDLRLMAAGGSQADYAADMAALKSATKVVLDLTAVLTVVELGLEAAVASRFEGLLIAQGSLDELREYQHELSARPPSGFAGGSGGQRYFIDVPPDYIERRMQLAQKALDFIQTHAQILPTTGMLDLNQVLLENLGQSAAGSLTLARDHNCALYSDDLHLRRLAQAGWQSSGFGIQMLLDDLLERGSLSEDQYYAGFKILAQHNYSFLRISAPGLKWALQASAMSIDAEVRTMFKPLTDPDCDPVSVARVLAEVIKWVWTGPWLDHQKLAVLDLALSTLATGRSLMQVLHLLEKALVNQFDLIPWQLKAVQTAIRTWRQLRLF
jgi:tetratricopeptide (TPR) repeat protein